MVNLYIPTEAGFGNKIFNIIICLYILNKIHTKQYIKLVVVIQEGVHNKSSDPTIDNIFPKLKNYLTFTPENKLPKDFSVRSWTKNNKKIYYSNLNDNNFNGLKKMINQNVKHILIVSLHRLYPLVYNAFNSFSKQIKNSFEINTKIISNNILNICKTKRNFVTIHIRYGDKLKIASNNEENNHTLFPIYTPLFYIQMIKAFNKTKTPIYIITDTEIIVKNHIINKLTNNEKKNITYLDVPYWDAFYLLKNSPYCVLSFSTFSLLSTMLNKRSNANIIVSRWEGNNKYLPEESLIDKLPNMFILKNKKYILNYDRKLSKELRKDLEKI